LVAQQSITVVSSELSLLEVLVKPLRDGNQALATLYRNILLGTAGMVCMPISRAILESAAQLRANHKLRTPDAIHAASSMNFGCSLFVTNDAGFRQVSSLEVGVLSEIAAS
jgi:predicted nucleic acid-binding protein